MAPSAWGIAVDRECMFRDYCIIQKHSVASTHHSFSQHVQLMAVHTVRQVCSGCTADTCFNRLMLVIWEHNHGTSYDFWSKAHGSETTKILNKLQDLRNNGSSDPGTFPSSAKVYLGFVLIHLSNNASLQPDCTTMQAAQQFNFSLLPRSPVSLCHLMQ